MNYLARHAVKIPYDIPRYKTSSEDSNKIEKQDKNTRKFQGIALDTLWF